MTKGVIMVFSNPVSEEREDEYNDWYSGIHFDELCAPEGVRAAKRFELFETQIPGNPPYPFKYLSVYELDDLDTAYPAMRALKTTPSDAIHPERRQIIFKEIHSFTKD